MNFRFIAVTAKTAWSFVTDDWCTCSHQTQYRLSFISCIVRRRLCSDRLVCKGRIYRNGFYYHLLFSTSPCLRSRRRFMIIIIMVVTPALNWLNLSKGWCTTAVRHRGGSNSSSSSNSNSNGRYSRADGGCVAHRANNNAPLVEEKP